MNNFEEPLIGPNPEDQETTKIEDVSETGEPLWMAFLEDHEALTISSDEVEVAKNAYDDFKTEHAEVIAMCARKPLTECKSLIEESMAEAA